MDFGSIKNVGTVPVDNIVKERNTNGLYKGFTDFCERIADESVNKKCIESLIKAGAFDEFEQTRSTLLASFEKIVDTIQSGKKKGLEGQVSMFDLGTKQEQEKLNEIKYTFEEHEELPNKEILSLEKEMLGIYISGHPLEKLRSQIEQQTNINTMQIRNIDEQMITKGAVEEILEICNMVDYKGQLSPITNKIKDNIKQIAKKLNKDGLRVIAVCQKNDLRDTTMFNIDDEKNMILLGFIGFLDPPKESAKSAIQKLNRAGIRVIVLTGDNAEVTECICKKVGINSKNIVQGNQIENLADAGVLRLLKKTNIFVKLSPIEKARIVRLLKESGNVVGYMGDGINDAPSLTNSDVGISVDTAVDIAKESADIILLEKDLHVLLDGVTEGRRTFGNLMKYIKMATSFNFGEVLSVIVASVALPFLPETPIQLLVEGLLYDFGQLTLPFDNVDEEYLQKPRTFSLKSLKNFMLFMGPLSSAFDLIVFACLWFVFKLRDPALFQTIWFTYSIVSNLLGMHIIRTAKIPFIQSNAHKMVYFSSIALCILGILVPFTWLGNVIGLIPIPLPYMSIIIGVPILYCFVAMFAKKVYIKKYGEWI